MIITDTQTHDFFSFMDSQIVLLRQNEQIGTAQNYLCAQRSFFSFLGRRQLFFHDISKELICQYELWLKKRDVSRNTISFYMRILRAVFNKAVSSGYVVGNNNDCFERVYTGVDTTVKRATHEDNIIRLKQLDLSAKPVLFYTRDLFLFSFYTRGMAFVDIAYLRKSNIKNGIIHYIRRKTGQSLNIRVEPCMQEIIDRYALHTQNTPYIFPIITTLEEDRAYKQYQNVLCYYNKQLKRLSSMLSLSIPLTSYVARHTWATAARNKNIPVSIISAGMGHTSESTTQIYLASLDTSVVDDANWRIIGGM